MLDFIDAQQDSLFSQINMLYETGRLKILEKAVEDYIKMDDQTLTEAFSQNEYIKNGEPQK